MAAVPASGTSGAYGHEGAAIITGYNPLYSLTGLIVGALVGSIFGQLYLQIVHGLSCGRMDHWHFVIQFVGQFAEDIHCTRRASGCTNSKRETS